MQTTINIDELLMHQNESVIVDLLLQEDDPKPEEKKGADKTYSQKELDDMYHKGLSHRLGWISAGLLAAHGAKALYKHLTKPKQPQYQMQYPAPPTYPQMPVYPVQQQQQYPSQGMHSQFQQQMQYPRGYPSYGSMTSNHWNNY